MKIKFEDLKLIYRDHIRSQVPVSRLDCPSLENIYHSLKGKKSRRYRSKLIDHISHCSLCLDDFDILRSLLLQENIALSEMNHLFPKAIKRDHGLKEERENYHLKDKCISFNLRKAIAFSLSLLAIAFLIIGLFTNRQLLKEMLFPRQNRSLYENELLLLHPECNKEYTASNLIFKWKTISRLDFYIIDIFDDTLLPIWKSPPIFESTFMFPIKLPEVIRPQKKYFWTVSAIKSNKVQIESRIGCFYLK